MRIDLRGVQRSGGVLTPTHLFEAFGIESVVPMGSHYRASLDDSIILLEKCLVQLSQTQAAIPFLVINDIHLMYKVDGTLVLVARLLHWAAELFVLTVKYTTSHHNAATHMLTFSGHTRLQAVGFPPASPLDVSRYLASYVHEGTSLSCESEHGINVGTFFLGGGET